ncbi:MAG: hypothetical protein IT561_11460 [Alphaproteobacteria bacterium]|nr:hypothetical protein [Alphaproteobacteria bacterium]
MTGERRPDPADDAEFFRAARTFMRAGIAVFPPDEETRVWATAMRAVAIAALDRPGVRRRADGTWLEADLGPADGLAPLVGPALRFLRRALGRPGLHLTRAQLSVVLPGHPRGDAWHVGERSRHIDGLVAPDRLVLSPAILGIVLCDLDGPGRGNPMAWDGSHLVTAAQLRRLAPDGTPRSVAAALHAGLPVEPRLCPPRLLGGPAGTAFVYHHGLQHGISPYPGSDGPPRPVLYYRMSMPTPDDTRLITDPLHHWPGLVPMPR